MKLRLYGPNLSYNGDAELGVVNSWSLHTETTSGAAASLSVNTASPHAGSYDFYLDISSGGSGISAVQVYQPGLSTPLGVKTALQFAGKAEDARQTTVSYMLGLSPWTAYLYEVVSLSTAYQNFEETFVMATQVNSGRITFYCGSGPVAQDIYFDNIGLRNYIELPTTYEYSATENLTRKDVRTKAGNLYSYIEPGSFRRFTLPLVHVNSAERSLINSWWATGSVLRLVEDATYPHSWRAVRITGAEEPLTKFTRPYNNEYEGELVLETV